MAYFPGVTVIMGLADFEWKQTGDPITSGNAVTLRIINEQGVVVDTQAITATAGVWSVVFDLPGEPGVYKVAAETTNAGATWRGVTQLLIDPFP
jgi:hypothetical protein